MTFLSTQAALTWFWEGEASVKCRSAECRAEPVSGTAGADWWFPPYCPGGQGAERWLVLRAEIAAALRAVVDGSDSDEERLRLHQGIAIARERAVGSGLCDTHRGWCGLRCPIPKGEHKRTAGACWAGVARRVRVSVTTAQLWSDQAVALVGAELTRREVVR